MEIWFQDEARIGQQGTVTRVWAEKGTRPRAVRQKQYQYTYLFGAVCPERDKGVALVMPQVNTECMHLHLEHISKAVPLGKHGVVVLDGAGWHKSKRLGRFSNLTLLPLPPASPELNPQEQVWQQLRDNDLANRTYADYDDIADTCCYAWNRFVERPGAIKKLCSRQWAILAA